MLGWTAASMPVEAGQQGAPPHDKHCTAGEGRERINQCTAAAKEAGARKVWQGPDSPAGGAGLARLPRLRIRLHPEVRACRAREMQHRLHALQLLSLVAGSWCSFGQPAAQRQEGHSQNFWRGSQIEICLQAGLCHSESAVPRVLTGTCGDVQEAIRGAESGLPVPAVPGSQEALRAV